MKKAEQRKSRKEKLQHYAGLLARASVIGSAVYKSLPAGRQKHALYKALTGSAMELLKHDWANEDVKAFLMKMMVKKPRVSAGLNCAEVFKIRQIIALPYYYELPLELAHTCPEVPAQKTKYPPYFPN
jgi:hypothetical protein